MAPLLSRAMLIASLMISSAEALAETHIAGLGNQNCEAWTANPVSSGGLGVLYQQWLFGFLSGVSFADLNHDPLKDMDVAAVTTWLGNYCQDNATARLVDAAIAFVHAHHP
jgi:hypothetical protein